MNSQEFVAAYNQFAQKAMSLIPEEMKKQLGERENRRCDDHPTAWDIYDINDTGMYFTQEYNDSCHCHPEYQNALIVIKWEDINNVA